MRSFRETKNMLLYNIWTLLGFESLFKILSFFIFTPFFFKLFDCIMQVTGYHYITLENIVSFIKNPFVVFFLFLLLLLLMLYTMFDITTIILILNESFHKRKIKVVDATRLSLKRCLRLLHPKNIGLSFMVLFLIPVLNLGVASNFITTLKVPEFLLEFIIQNKILLSLLILFFFFFLFLFFRWIYALHYFVLEEGSFKEAREKSKNLVYKKRLSDIGKLLGIQFLMTLFYLLFVAIGIAIILLFNKIFASILVLKSVATTIIWVFIAISFIIFTVLTTPIGYAALSALFYIHKKETKEDIKNILEIKNNKDITINKKIKSFLLASVVLAILGGSVFTYGLYTGKYNLNIEHTRMVEATAHRGASKEYPENTMIAFQGAKNLGTDWIELDVQQTKDQVLVVLHDANLKRTTGVDKKIVDVTYEEIKDLDVGSHFHEKFKGEKIPLLEEVIQFAKENRIRLNIELKPTGKEKDFEKSVVDLLYTYDFLDSCIITSGHYEVLQKVKAYDKKIKTGYIMTLFYGKVEDFFDADLFSMEATNVTKSLVKNIHALGKEIHVWTVNTKENIEKMLDLRVDNIITDDVYLTKECIYQNKTSNLINEFIKWIETVLK